MLTRVAMVFGIVFLLVGIVGFITPGGMSMAADPAPGMILGMFGVNLLHNVVHCLVGVWGLVASRSFNGAKMYMQIGGVIYLVLAVLGFVVPTTFGLIPIGGADIYLHAVLGLIMAGIGFTAKPAGAAAPAV
jgi:hypothetical protein